MILEHSSMWVEIFMENKRFVEIFLQQNARARSSGGRARLWLSVVAGGTGQVHSASARPRENARTLPDSPQGAIEFLRHVPWFGLF